MRQGAVLMEEACCRRQVGSDVEVFAFLPSLSLCFPLPSSTRLKLSTD